MDSTTPNVFLGFSGSVLSLMLEALVAQRRLDDVLIVENLRTEDQVTYLPPGIIAIRTTAEEWKFDAQRHALMFSMATARAKRGTFQAFTKLKGVKEEHFASLQSTHVSLASTATIGRGCYLEPGVVVSPFAELGFGVTINRGSSIGHHTILERFVTVNPGCHIAGHCRLGPGVTLGIGTVVFDHISIGEGSVIGGGSVVNKDVPAGVLAFGNPCRIVKPLDA